MPDPTRELRLEELPRPPLYALVDGAGRDAFAEAEVGGESATVGVLFGDEAIAREFAEDAGEHGLGVLAGLEPRTLPTWAEVETFASAGEDYVLVISGSGTGLFHAADVARRAVEAAGELAFPLYLIADERGEAPLITVETDGGEVLVAALFTSQESARSFREAAAHLGLPEGLGTIADAEGLARHARVAGEAGAEYAVFDPETGLTEAIPIEELMREPHQR